MLLNTMLIVPAVQTIVINTVDTVNNVNCSPISTYRNEIARMANSASSKVQIVFMV